MKTCLLIANAGKEKALEHAQRTREWLTGKVEVLDLMTDSESDLSSTSADFVVVFGGDGTALNAVRRLGVQPPPLLIVNLGRLGFLAEVNPAHIEFALQKVIADEHGLSERMFLHGRMMDGSREVWHGHAVNEFLIGPEGVGRMIEVQVRVDDLKLTRFSGDGLIIASPTGSTAYAMSAGGPIVSPELRAMVLVPVCPHHLANRPLVMDGREVLLIDHAMPEGVVVSPDGQDAIPLELGHVLEVKGSGRTFRLIQTGSGGRYDTLREKLGWGAKFSSDRSQRRR